MLMNRNQAHKILDSVRNGANVSEWKIVEALKITGDVCELSDYPVVRVRPQGTWEMRSRGLAPAVWCGVVG